MFSLSPIYSARVIKPEIIQKPQNKFCTQIYIQQNIHKHWTQHFRRMSPFGITPVKKYIRLEHAGTMNIRQFSSGLYYEYPAGFVWLYYEYSYRLRLVVLWIFIQASFGCTMNILKGFLWLYYEYSAGLFGCPMNILQASFSCTMNIHTGFVWMYYEYCAGFVWLYYEYSYRLRLNVLWNFIQASFGCTKTIHTKEVYNLLRI